MGGASSGSLVAAAIARECTEFFRTAAAELAASPVFVRRGLVADVKGAGVLHQERAGTGGKEMWRRAGRQDKIDLGKDLPGTFVRPDPIRRAPKNPRRRKWHGNQNLCRTDILNQRSRLFASDMETVSARHYAPYYGPYDGAETGQAHGGPAPTG